MPCDCSHLEPTEKEAELLRVNILLLEIETGRCPTEKEQAKFGCYGVGDLDALTRELCKACKKLGAKMKSQSLELQIWWRDHQKADSEKAKSKTRLKQKAVLRARAVAKLTRAERKVLGL